MATDSIKLWPEHERPREKFWEKGAEALSDAELLALLLRSGSGDRNAVGLAREVLRQFGGLRGLLSRTPQSLCEIRGLGPAKAAAVGAVPELARRFLREAMLGKSYLRDPQAVVDYLVADLRDRKREMFKVLFLDKGHAVIVDRTLFTGTVDRTAVHPREIIREALEHHASALVLVHNHPSGRADPSAEDCELTRRMASLCEGLSLKVLDHLIIADNGYYSFREHGLV